MGETEKVLDIFIDLQDNLGKEVEIYYKRDRRRIRGILSKKLGDFYLRWPKIHLTILNATVEHKGRVTKRNRVHLYIDPLRGGFEYSFKE